MGWSAHRNADPERRRATATRIRRSVRPHTRRWTVGLIALALVAPALAPGRAHADTATFQQYPIPGAFFTDAVTQGPDGNMWFGSSGQIGFVTPAGQVTVWPTPGGLDVFSVTVGPDGKIWFPMGSSIWTVDASGQFTDMHVSTGGAASVALGPDGNVWYASPNGYVVGKVTPAGVNTPYAIPRATSPVQNEPLGITAGPDGNMWIAQDFQIGRITLGGSLKEFTLTAPPMQGIGAVAITTGPDGNLWWVENQADRVGRITTTGSVTEFPMPSEDGQANGIAVGPDGNLYFTEEAGDRIGQVTTSGVIREIHTPAPQVGPFGIAAGPDGRVWFTEMYTGSLNAFDPASIQPPPAPCMTISTSTTLTQDVGPCSGDGIDVVGSNLTLNLNGHKLFGTNGHLGDFAGVRILGGSGVQVIGGSSKGVPGTITGFDAGVLVRGGSGNVIAHLLVTENFGAAGQSSLLGDGILIEHSAGNQVLGNTVRHNGIYDDIAVLGVDSNNNTIQGNTVEQADDLRAFVEGAGEGIIINPFLETSNPRRGESIYGNNVISNVVRDNVGPGISILSDVSATIRGNLAQHNGFRADGRPGLFPGNGIGIHALAMADHSTKDVIDANTVLDNFGDGLQDFNSYDNQFTRNSGNGNGSPLDWRRHYDLSDFSQAFLPGSGPCSTNVWVANTWGTGGYSNACVTFNGHGPKPSSGSLSAAQTAEMSHMEGDVTFFARHGKPMSAAPAG